jgi:hypothetical protein
LLRHASHVGQPLDVFWMVCFGEFVKRDKTCLYKGTFMLRRPVGCKNPVNCAKVGNYRIFPFAICLDTGFGSPLRKYVFRTSAASDISDTESEYLGLESDYGSDRRDWIPIPLNSDS